MCSPLLGFFDTTCQAKVPLNRRAATRQCFIIGVVIIDPQTVPVSIAYQLLTTTVIPRPIGFISSLSPEGVANLAPFSFFNAVCGEPPMIMFSAANRHPLKDTLRNVHAIREFVVNIVSEEIAEAMNLTAGDYASDVSEFDVSGLTPVASDIVRPPRVLESPVNLECRVHHIVKVSDKPMGGSIVIGEVVRFHVRDSIIDKDMLIDPDKLKPVARLGGPSYSRIRDRFDMLRPVVKK
jgi:flavin reductase (DIM6/NTAB) family NADH-FMN oxidoreductase RutF